ncbi:MAG: hypothetical protein ACLR23_19515 [Clostridia bacterium]
MLRLIWNEWARLISGRFLMGAILLLLCLNLGFASSYRVDPYIPNSAYRQISYDLTQYAREHGADAMCAYLQEKVTEYTIYQELMWGDAGYGWTGPGGFLYPEVSGSDL